MVDGLSTGDVIRTSCGRDTQGSVLTRRPAGPLGATGFASASRASPRPQLLVSVRNADEAAAALAGGADIIDVKEPQRGALGMADPVVIASIVACVSGRVPVSAALGELREWTTREDRWLTVDGLSMALEKLSFVKLGLAGCGRTTGWVAAWLDLRGRIEQAAGRTLPWVAVAYADETAAEAPSVLEIIEAAGRTGCRGVLIDTFNKQSGSLLDHSSTPALSDWESTGRAAGLFLALAGRLRAEDVGRPELRCADIIGVRSAACDADDRQRGISPGRVAALRKRLLVESH